MAAGTEEGHGRAGPGAKRRGGRLREVGWAGELEEWGSRRAAAAAREEPGAGGRAGAVGSSGPASAFARLSAATGRQSPRPRPPPPPPYWPLPPAPAACRRRRRRRAQCPPSPTLGAPALPPPNPRSLIGCRPRRPPGNAVRGLGRRGRKEEEASPRGGEEWRESF